MAIRPLAFSVRLRDGDRTVRIHNDPKAPRRYVLEDERAGEATRVRAHDTAADALQDAAATWRRRLH